MWQSGWKDEYLDVIDDLHDGPEGKQVKSVSMSHRQKKKEKKNVQIYIQSGVTFNVILQHFPIVSP